MGCFPSQEAPPKKGYVFRLRLLGGLNLYNNSFGVQIPGTQTSALNFSGKSDPYVTFDCHGVKKKSKTILHTLNPVWNEDFYFNVDTTMPILKLTVFDADAVSKDDAIGRAEINLHGLIQRGKETEFWVPLQGAKANGEIGLSVIECYRSHVTLKDGRDVKPMDALSGSSDVYATVRVGQQELQRTQTKSWTLNPVWNQRFTVFVPYGVESQLEVILWDHDRVGVDSNMGWFYKKLDGKPKEGIQDFSAQITNAQGSLQYSMQDDTVIEVPAPGPVTEDMKKKFPPTAPQTANFQLRLVGGYNFAASDKNYVGDFIDNRVNEFFHEYHEPKPTSDPFVRLSCEGQVYESKHVKNSLDPFWNQTFRFIARNKETSEVKLEVIDYDLLSNDSLGKVVLPLASMKPGENTELWSFLDAGRGEIGIELQMNFQLKVRVVSCKDLPAKDLNGMCDPYVKVTVAGETYQTRVCRDNRAPWIDEQFRWSVGTLENVILRAEVFDSDLMLFKKGLSEDFLGAVDIPLTNLTAGLPVAFDLPLKVSGKETGSIRLEITNEIPLPPSALAEIAAKGEAALKAAVAKANEAKQFIKELRAPNPDTKDEGEFEVVDKKIDLRPRYTRVAVDVVALRGVSNCTSPLYVGVSVPLQGQRYKTKEYNDSKNPDINETFTFNVPTKAISGIEVTIFESNKHSYTGSWSTTSHSRGFLAFKDFNNNQGLIRGSPANDTWIPLSNGGEACVRVRELYRFNVRVIRAKGLNTKADPYVLVKYDKETQRTNTVSKDPAKDRTEGIPGEPIWNEQFTFFSATKGVLTFKIMDAEVLSEDKALDQVTFDMTTLRRGVPVTTTIKTAKGAELTVFIKEEEKMALMDQIIDAAANAAKLAEKAAKELAGKATEAVGNAVGAIGGALGGLFGK